MAGDGTSSGFNATQFRDAIHFAMGMGAPPAVSEQVTFLVPGHDTYAVADPAHDPYDWTSTPTSTVPAQSIVVPVAVTFVGGNVEGDALGVFDASRVALTLLDVDWQQVSAATEVLVGGSHYVIDPPGAVPIGLFDVTVYELRASARS